MRNTLNSLLEKAKTRIKNIEALADHYTEAWGYPEQISATFSDGRRVIKFQVSLQEGHYRVVSFKEYNSCGVTETPLRFEKLKVWQLSVLLEEEGTVTLIPGEPTVSAKVKRKV